jgi:biotin synthesis protein BioG
MKTCWLRRKGSSDCLLFMSGWGMGPEPFAEVDFGLSDVLLVYDYRDWTASELAVLAERSNVHLLAWSLGVYAAAWLAQHDPLFAALPFRSATALGGTLQPVDDRCGIPAQQFEAMLKCLTPNALDVFYRSMFDEEREVEHFLRRKPGRSVVELRDELESLYKLCRSSQAQLPDIYSRRIVTARDRIFPARNQIRAWGREKSSLLALPHFPFYAESFIPAAGYAARLP